MDYSPIYLRFDSALRAASSAEPDHFLQESSGAVTAFIEDDDEETHVGTFRTYFVDVVGAANAGKSAHDVFDTSGSTYGYLGALYCDDAWNFRPAVMKALKAHQLTTSPSLLILDRLLIAPEWRGRGIGLHALVGLMHWLQPGAGVAAIKPYPLQFEAGHQDPHDPERPWIDGFKGNFRTCRAKLCRYYAQLGFKRVPHTGYMVRRCDQGLPNIQELPSRLASSSSSS